MALLYPSLAFATPLFRGYSAKDRKVHECDQVTINQDTGKAYCYVKNSKGVLASIGLVTLRMWTGLYDAQNAPIYEFDTVSTPNYPTGIMMLGNAQINTSVSSYYGWYILSPTGNLSFSDISSYSRDYWSRVINNGK